MEERRVSELTAVSVFSGIGGLDLGVELGGIRVVAQCEAVDYRRRVLAARFGNAPIYADVRQLDAAVFTDPWAGGQLAPESPRQGDDTDGDLERDGRDGEGLGAFPGVGERGVDGLVGGFPCQDLSVAGKRKGLGGGRSGLYWEIPRLIAGAAVRPRFVLLENVPGLLSSCSCRGCRKCGVLLRWHRDRGCPGAPGPDGADAGAGDGAYGQWVKDGGCAACRKAKEIRKRHAGTDFAVVCAALANLGYRVSYRVLDSRHFGVAQRRRRVFILAELDPRAHGRGEVLLEPEGGARDPVASGSPWPGAAAALAGRAGSGGGGVAGDARGVPSHAVAPPLVSQSGDAGVRTTDVDTAAYVVDDVSATLKGQRGKGGGGIGPEETLVPAEAHYYVEDHEDGTLRSNGGDGSRTDRQPLLVANEEAATLTKGSSSAGVSYPGRRKEDDENLVVMGGSDGSESGPDPVGVSGAEPGRGTTDGPPMTTEEPQTFDWQLSGGGSDKSFRGKGRSWIEDKPGTARALTSNKTLAVHVPDVSPALSAGEGHRMDTEQPNVVAFQQTPQGDLLEDSEDPGITPPLLGREGSVGNNSPMVATEPWAVNWEGDDPGNTPPGETPPLGAGHAGSIAVGFIAGSSPATGGIGAEDEIAPTLGSQANGSTRTPTVAKAYTKTHGAQSTDDAELWDEADVGRTLNGLAMGVDVVVEEVAHTLRAEGFDASEDGTGRGTPMVTSFESRFARNGRGAPSPDVPPLKASSGTTGKGDGAPMVMAVSENQRRELRESEHAPSLGEPSGHMGQGLPSVRSGAAVRRLTPTECERLQGLPDGWTMLGPDTADGPRYAAIGDAVTVNVPRWIIARYVRREALEA